MTIETVVDTAEAPDVVALPIRGLTQAEVDERVRRGETNNFHPQVGRTYWQIVRFNVFNVFTITMGVLLGIVALLGDWSTVVFAGFAVVTNALFGTIQEALAKRKFDRLMADAAPMVTVIRDGQEQSISVYAVVRDDVLPLESGAKIIADGHLLASDSLEVDESQLTGESDAVLKAVGSPVSSGSFCVAGSGVMVAQVVGADSTVNRLTTLAKQYRYVLTPTQHRINVIVQLSIFLMAVFTPMILVSGYMQTGEWVNLANFQSAVVFVASIVPQGLVLTATISLTIGAIVISRRQTLVQRVNAVESMGNVTCLCFDKTGTLTENRLAVQELLPYGGVTEDEFRQKLRLFVTNLSTANRTAGAVGQFVGVQSQDTPAVRKRGEVPFSSTRKWSAIVLPGETLMMGAPERLLTEADYELMTQSTAYAERGYRVVAFSSAPVEVADQALPDERRPLGLIVLSDRTRSDMRETLEAFQRQGVELKVISGDNLETVREVATKAGMHIRRAHTGDELRAMDDVTLAQAAQEANLFARIEPDQKRQLVAALKRAGHYVAMTGDGVNDVPSLKEAHLAIAMNDGAQITKDVADIVLLNNALTTLPQAFSEGRTITQIIFATCKIFLIKNFYSLLFFVFAGFMFMPFPINPTQISWVTFGVINVMATLITVRVFVPTPMKHFREDVLDFALTGGAIGAVAATLVYAVTYLSSGRDVLAARSVVLVFLTLFGLLVFWNVCGLNLLDPRTWPTKPRIFLAGLASATITILAAYILPQVLSFVPLTPMQWALAISVLLLLGALMQIGMRTRYFANLVWRLSAPP